MKDFKQKARIGIVLILASLYLPVNIVLAVCPPETQSCSNSYRVDQTFFGSGGELNACSGQYCSKQTLGELAAGETNSANYRAYAGFNTTDDPYIEFFVCGINLGACNNSINIGILDTAHATTTTGQFYVRAWQASGYVVRTEAVAPTNTSSNYQLTQLTTPTASSPGTEQFGINLVKNANFCGASCDVGSDPVQVPDNTFSFGQVESNYNTDGLFAHNKGDIVSRSNQSSSVTIYTVSYLFNISDTTPSGQYIFRHNLVATGTY